MSLAPPKPEKVVVRCILRNIFTWNRCSLLLPRPIKIFRTPPRKHSRELMFHEDFRVEIVFGFGMKKVNWCSWCCKFFKRSDRMSSQPETCCISTVASSDRLKRLEMAIGKLVPCAMSDTQKKGFELLLLSSWYQTIYLSISTVA